MVVVVRPTFRVTLALCKHHHIAFRWQALRKDPPPQYQHELADGRKINVGAWCMNQRKAKKKGNMMPERVAQLDSIGFVWSRGVIPTWEEHYKALQSYKVENSGQDPPADATVQLSNGQACKLGKWCDTQRRLRREGQLKGNKEQLLDGLGFSCCLLYTSPSPRDRG